MSGKKADEVDDSNPYANLDKAAVIQECRSFNEVPLNSRKCIKILCKLLYLLQHGQKITKVEATDTFFAITKLFQSKSPTLRCLVYVAIKELYAISDDVIIVMSCLTKDMTGGNNTYRPSAIRALCRIVDADLLPTVERYIKQAIVDKAVSSAALVSSLHLFRRYPDFVRRWSNEIQGVVATNEEMIQFHALSLLYHIRSNDKLAIIKLVQKYGKPAVLRSPLAICYMIRIAAKLFESERDQQAFAFVESCLRHKNEIVMYEAALAIVRLSEISSGDLASVIRVLQIFIISPKPSVRFAGVRTLNKIAMKYPQAVICCNAELEQLIVDQNRSIATLAITTLLITGSETSVERLMKQIGVFVTEISDEFKIVVISAVRSLCKRYPAKHETMMIFLTSMLRDEGNYEYKRALIDTIILIIEDNPDICESVEMSRLQQLKLLFDEIQILFDQGIGEQEAYDRLNSDSRFDSIRRTDIHYLYQKLQKKVELENEEKDLNKEMQSYNKILDSLKADQARLKNSYNQADSDHNYISLQKQHFTAEYVKFKPYRQNAKKYLISDTVAKSFKPYITSFWQGRYALEVLNTKGNLHAFDLTDLFHDKSKKITVQRVGRFAGFYELFFPYVLLVEIHASGTYFLRLMGLDPSTNQMQLIQEIERGTYFQVFVDTLNPKNFVLQNNASVEGSKTNVCTLVNGRVQIGEEELEWKVNSMPAYSDGQLLGFWCEPHYTMENTEMKIFDLKQNKKTSLKMNSFLRDVDLRSTYSPNIVYAWIQNRCYVNIKFNSSKNYGVAYADSETRNWIVLEFASNLPLYRLQMTTDQELMFYAEGNQLKNESKLMERRVFKIPLKKPDFLRCLAWFKFVGLMKKTQVSNDPKRKARMRLPYNTDVQLFKCIR